MKKANRLCSVLFFYTALHASEKPNPILTAIAKDNKANLEAALCSGVDVDAPNEQGFTGLMSAAALGKMDFIQLLVQHKADVNAVSHKGETALMHASKMSHVDVVCCLVAHGAEILESIDGEVPQELQAIEAARHRAIHTFLSDRAGMPRDCELLIPTFLWEKERTLQAYQATTKKRPLT